MLVRSGDVCVHAKSLQSCPTLCNPINCGPPGSSVHGILQARILEWVAISTSGDLPDPGIKPASLRSLALTGRFFTTSTKSLAGTANEDLGRGRGTCGHDI